MLVIIENLKQLDFSQLMQVYEQSNRENGSEFYPSLSASEQLLCAEQDFYAYLITFFKTTGAFYAVWVHQNRYVAALRMEPYQDGLLLEALETHPEQRKKGYARILITETLQWLQNHRKCKVYAHIHKKNIASQRTHLSCGFTRILEYARYVDGSVTNSSCTCMIEN